jgi:hypothetical protein
MPTADRKLHVFLCHSSQDKPIVRELYQRLIPEDWIIPGWMKKSYSLVTIEIWRQEISDRNSLA